MTDLAGSLVTSCRPPGRLQKRPDDRTWNAGVAVRTADGSRLTADAGDEQRLLCGCSSASCTVVLDAVCAGVHSDGKAPQRGSQLTSPASSQRRSGTVAAQSVAAGTSPLPPAVVAPLRRKDFFFHVAVRSRSGAVRLRRQTCQDRRRSDFGDLLPDVLLY